MNGPGSLTVGSIDPQSQGQFQVDVAGGSLYVADVANAQTLSVVTGSDVRRAGDRTFSGPASFAGNSTLSVALNGTGAGQFTQLTDTAVVPPGCSRGGRRRTLALSVGYSPTAGDTFTIIAAPNGTSPDSSPMLRTARPSRP